MNILSSEKEIVKHVNGAFGFDEDASYLENAFISGAEYIRADKEDIQKINCGNYGCLE